MTSTIQNIAEPPSTIYRFYNVITSDGEFEELCGLLGENAGQAADSESTLTPSLLLGVTQADNDFELFSGRRGRSSGSVTST